MKASRKPFRHMQRGEIERIIICKMPTWLLFFLIHFAWFVNSGSNNSQKQPGPDGALRTVVIQERRLHVGVHNGWCFLEKPQVVVLQPPKVLPRGGADSSSKQSSLLRDRWVDEHAPWNDCSWVVGGLLKVASESDTNRSGSGWQSSPQ